jgi:hypothetical protein
VIQPTFTVTINTTGGGSGAQATNVPVGEIGDVVNRWVRQGLVVGHAAHMASIEIRYAGDANVAGPDVDDVAAELRHLAEVLSSRR